MADAETVHAEDAEKLNMGCRHGECGVCGGGECGIGSDEEHTGCSSGECGSYRNINVTAVETGERYN